MSGRTQSAASGIHRAERRSYRAVKPNSRNWRDWKWQHDAPTHGPRPHPSHVKQAINMHRLHTRTCRWCRHSPCTSHSSQCPVRSCRNVFCWKAQRWHIRGKRVMFYVCVCLSQQRHIQVTFSLVELNFWHTHPCKYNWSPLWNHPWLFFNERYPFK